LRASLGSAEGDRAALEGADLALDDGLEQLEDARAVVASPPNPAHPRRFGRPAWRTGASGHRRAVGSGTISAFVRRLARTGASKTRDRLFPTASLEERLGAAARLRSIDLLDVPGRPARTEASFRDVPRYEFDNLDEMLWWKHCRHLSGPVLPQPFADDLRAISPVDCGLDPTEDDLGCPSFEICD